MSEGFHFDGPWAIESSLAGRIHSMLVRGESVAPLLAGKTRTRSMRPFQRNGNVGVIPIRGVIAAGAEHFGGTSAEQISTALRAALDDDSVESILLDIDSPGGAVSGVDDLAEEIRAARAHKPIVALADGMMASAALWLGAQASRVLATRSTQVGSIGVVAPMLDAHRALEQMGVDVHMVTSVPGKVPNDRGAVGPTASREAQELVDAVHGLFVDAVAAGRGLDPQAAHALADGRVHIASKAKDVGLIDDVGSFAQAMAVAREAGSGSGGTRMAAAVSASPEGNMASERGASAPDAGLQAEAKPAQQQPQLEARRVSELMAEGAQNERLRQKQIRAMASADQSELVEQLIESGADESEAAKALALDYKAKHRVEHERRLNDLRRAGRPVGQLADDGDEVVEGAAAAKPQTPEEEFAASSKLRGMFDTPEKWAFFKSRKPDAAAALLKGGV